MYLYLLGRLLITVHWQYRLFHSPMLYLLNTAPNSPYPLVFYYKTDTMQSEFQFDPHNDGGYGRVNGKTLDEWV